MDMIRELQGQAAIQNLDMDLANLDIQLENEARTLQSQENLRPWLDLTARTMGHPPTAQHMPEIADMLRRANGPHLGELPRTIGALGREMQSRGVDARRLEVVREFLSVFYRLLGD